MEDIVGLIGTLGFPIAVSVYLLFERRSVTKDLISAVRELTLTIHDLSIITKTMKRK